MDPSGLEESEDDQPVEEEYATFTIRTKPNQKQKLDNQTSPVQITVITFKVTSNNINRSRNNICTFLNLDDAACDEAAATTLVRYVNE